MTKSAKLLAKPVITLELTDEKFYHLDTCLSILNKDSAVVVPEAFSEESWTTLKGYFKNLIEVPKTEAEHQLAANCFSPQWSRRHYPRRC